MDRSKKLFLIIAAVFLIIIVLIGVDFARRTSFPGVKNSQTTDSAVVDSLFNR
jgi:hypothetical protein